MSMYFLRHAILFALFFLFPIIGMSQMATKFDLRGTLPYQVFVDNMKYPEFGSFLFRCDDGDCFIITQSYLCDKNEAFIGSAVVTNSRISKRKVLFGSDPIFSFQLIDEGLSCEVKMSQGDASNCYNDGRTFCATSMTCTVFSGFLGKTKTYLSQDSVDIKKLCKELILRKAKG